MFKVKVPQAMNPITITGGDESVTEYEVTGGYIEVKSEAEATFLAHIFDSDVSESTPPAKSDSK